MKPSFLNPLSDPIFKQIFGREKAILTDFINAIIQPAIPVVDLEYLPLELAPDDPGDKIPIVDVRCMDEQKRQFIVEIQVANHPFLKERMLYYASKSYGRQLTRGQKYQDLQNVYHLTLLNFTIQKKDETWLHRYQISNIENPGDRINGIELVFLEIDKCRKLGNFNSGSLFDLWITFLTEPEKLLEMYKHKLKEYPNLKKAVELLDESKYTAAQLAAHDRYLDSIYTWNTCVVYNYDNGFDNGFNNGLQKGEELGVDKGLSKAALIIKELRLNQKTEEQIAADFNVSLETIRELKGL